jgi:V8-like Glu-specific endopeptidase
MNKKRFIPIMVLVLLAMLVSSVFLPGVTAITPEAEVAGDGNISSAADQVTVAAARPWTQEEMDAAEPYPLPEVEQQALDAFLEGFVEETVGEEVSFPSGLSGDMAGSSLAPGVEEVFVQSAETLGYSYPAPFSRYVVYFDYRRYPHRTVGKVFFNQYGKSYVCSAASMGNYAVWTAGHCVHAGNNSASGWSTNFVFVPAYKKGVAPYGQWSAENLWTRTQWYKYANLGEDMGGAILYTLGGKKISQRVGWLGFKYNASRNLHWHLMGYPAAAPFDGRFQWVCASSYAYNYTKYSPLPVGVGCDQTGGTSGGPWIWKLSGAAGATNYLNGENSFRRTSYKNELFSPYFGAAAYSLWSSLRADTP